MGEMNDQHLLLLGEIKGKVDGLADADKAQAELLQSIDSRLRSVEQTARVNGAVSGGVISVGMAIIIEVARQVMGRGAGPQG